MNSNQTDNFDYGSFNLANSIIVTIIATFGNVGILFILAKPDLQLKSLFQFILVAAIFDTINSITIWPVNYPNFFLINQNDISCKLSNYLAHVSGTFASWINVFTSIDCFIQVKFSSNRFPFRKKNQYSVLLMLILFVFSCSMYWTDWTYLSIKPGYCSTDYAKTAFYLELYCSFVFIIIPFIIIAIVNAITFCQLKKNQSNKIKFKKDKTLFRFSSGINFLYLTCNLPVYLSLVINSIFNFCIIY